MSRTFKDDRKQVPWKRGKQSQGPAKPKPVVKPKRKKACST